MAYQHTSPSTERFDLTAVKNATMREELLVAMARYDAGMKPTFTEAAKHTIAVELEHMDKYGDGLTEDGAKMAKHVLGDNPFAAFHCARKLP